MKQGAANFDSDFVSSGARTIGEYLSGILVNQNNQPYKINPTPKSKIRNEKGSYSRTILRSRHEEEVRETLNLILE